MYININSFIGGLCKTPRSAPRKTSARIELYKKRLRARCMVDNVQHKYIRLKKLSKVVFYNLQRKSS